MAVTRRSSGARYLLLILVLVAATLVTLDQRGGRGPLTTLRSHVQDLTRPIQGAVHSALQPIGDFLTGAAEYGSLRTENQRLRQEVTSLQLQGLTAEAALARAGQVLAQEHLPFVGDIPTVAAEVIDSGSSNFESTATLDRGSADGIAVGQPVLATNGLVGSIGAVTARTSTVRLLTDPAFVVGVTLADGVASAAGSGLGQPLLVNFISPPTGPGNVESTFSVKTGTPVFTSGVDLAAFPPGIPVATVATFANRPGSTDPTVTLKPVVDLSRLSLVRIELWSPQTPHR